MDINKSIISYVSGVEFNEEKAQELIRNWDNDVESINYHPHTDNCMFESKEIHSVKDIKFRYVVSCYEDWESRPLNIVYQLYAVPEKNHFSEEFLQEIMDMNDISVDDITPEDIIMHDGGVCMAQMNVVQDFPAIEYAALVLSGASELDEEVPESFSLLYGVFKDA